MLARSQLADATDKYEVCRMFLATLQLTNDGNVDIATSGSLDTGDLSMTVSLLNKERRPKTLDADPV